MTAVKNKTGPKPMVRNECLVAGCESIADHPVSGLCEIHYRRLRRTGTTTVKRRSSGSGTITKYGYIAVGGSKGAKAQEHTIIVESVLGKPLPEGAEIHHVNGDKSDNTKSNLVVCPSRAYHKMLHQREASLHACGNPNYRKCPFCKQYGNTDQMSHNKSSRYFYHLECKNEYRRSRA